MKKNNHDNGKLNFFEKCVVFEWPFDKRPITIFKSKKEARILIWMRSLYSPILLVMFTSGLWLNKLFNIQLSQTQRGISLLISVSFLMLFASLESYLILKNAKKVLKDNTTSYDVDLEDVERRKSDFRLWMIVSGIFSIIGFAISAFLLIKYTMM